MVGSAVVAVLAAAAVAAVIGIALAALLAVCAPPGRRLWVAVLLLAPIAAVLAVPRVPVIPLLALLATPIVAALGHRALAACWSDYAPTMLTCGADRWRALPMLVTLARPDLAAAALVGLGCTIAEAGAMQVGGAGPPALAAVAAGLTIAIGATWSRA